MAFVTLCPQCQTGFSVQPDHFSTADGWVRCGPCAHVFPLDQHLFEMDDPRPVPELVQPLSRPVALTDSQQLPPEPHHGWAGYVLALLVLVFILQWAIHQRHAIAGRVPELHPVMQWLCQPFSCDVYLPMDPNQVSLESSRFKRVEPDTFVFEGVVKNLGDSLLSPPALELTLNSEGSDVVRTIITPTELGLNEPLRPRGNHAFFVSFRLDPSLSPTIDGFKALLFYP
jgi:predicted Zn finger-like uncharacterized protein